MNTRETGQTGERAAERYLKRNGFRILARNYRAGRHEIDLIALDKATDTVVFVEVKARTAVNAAKQRYLRLAAQQWLAENGGAERSARFDVIEVFLPEGSVNRVENAF